LLRSEPRIGDTRVSFFVTRAREQHSPTRHPRETPHACRSM
jgi:hypothetical protein